MALAAVSTTSLLLPADVVACTALVTPVGTWAGGFPPVVSKMQSLVASPLAFIHFKAAVTADCVATGKDPSSDKGSDMTMTEAQRDETPPTTSRGRPNVARLRVADWKDERASKVVMAVGRSETLW